MNRPSPSLVFGTAAGLPVFCVTCALFTQHVLGMQPCPWCVLQRAIFLSISLAALLGLALRGAVPRRMAALAMLVLAGCGLAAAMWQHFVAANSASCNMTFADRVMSGLGLDAVWPEVFAAYASCADAAATLLGIPYEFYSGGNFLLLGAAALWLLRHPRT